jgi:DNA-binding CsgD family transcriptional regulator
VVSAGSRTPTRPGEAAALTGEAVLTGAPAARRLYREIAAAPAEPLLLSVIGVGGSGKTVLLDVLATLYAESGVRVSRSLAAHPDTSAVLLIDDAHLLGRAELDRLTELAAGSTGLVLAQRPWPQPAGLTELTGLLTRNRPPLLLGNLDRSGVAGRAAPLTEGRPPAALVDHVAAETGGLPLLVDRLLGALREAGRLDKPPTEDAPAGLVEQLYYELGRQPEPVGELVLALAIGAPLDNEVLAPLLAVPSDQVEELVEQARSAGLLGDNARPRPILGRTALRRTPSVRRLALRRRLAQVQLDRGGSVLASARNLLDTGATGARVAAVFEAGADEALRDGSPLAGRLLEAAVGAGVPPLRLAARGAEAAARVGDLDRALELADQVLADPAAVTVADRIRAVTVAAAALAQRGLLARSAELYRWLGAEPLGPGAVVAVPALIGTGALDDATALLEPQPASALSSSARSSSALSSSGPSTVPLLLRPPTLLAGAEALMARGVYDTITGSSTAALSQLARAAVLLEPTAATVLLPDTPAALAALVAAHCGELDVAQSVLERAVAAGLGGRIAVARHRLLQAWIAMSRGATTTARALLSEVDTRATEGPDATGRLEPRDELVAAALEVGLARRCGDLAALMPAWGRAREAIVRHPVDLYVLQPLGELIVASARLREQAWVRPHLQEAHALLARLGYPVLWSASVYWSELHAALQAESWAEAGRQAEALERAAESGSRYAGAMAVAARSWLAVLRGVVDQSAVESAARGLHAVGLSWDGGKLAGQGAIRTTDRKAMTALLQCARGLQSSGHTAEAPPGAPVAAPSSGSWSGSWSADPGAGGGRVGSSSAGPTPVTSVSSRASVSRASVSQPGDGEADDEPAGALSDREREVAALVIEGLTYKQIGEQLFISAKTVEHHVARMRQRLGSTSRGELMAHLRMIVGSS